MAESEAALREALEGLRGLRHHHVAIDREACRPTSVSVRETLWTVAP